MKKKLKCKIIYLRKNIFNKNLLEKKIKPGEILFLPNSRLNSGEEKNSIKLDTKKEPVRRLALLLLFIIAEVASVFKD